MRFETFLAPSLVIALAAALPFSEGGSDLAKRETDETVQGDLFETNQDSTTGASPTDTYTFYRGNGSPEAGWPAMSDWISFDQLFNGTRELMMQSCEAFTDQLGNRVADNSDEEMDGVYTAIQQVANETGVDQRFILAVVIQESWGCVRAPTTNGGVRNPGLMQDHNGSATCNSDIAPYLVQNPCPQDTITEMIREGTAGTPYGDGLANCINEADATGSEAYYKAARIYNSGSIAASGNLEDGIATNCYAADIANRLTGWVHAPLGCTA